MYIDCQEFVRKLSRNFKNFAAHPTGKSVGLSPLELITCRIVRYSLNKWFRSICTLKNVPLKIVDIFRAVVLDYSSFN